MFQATILSVKQNNGQLVVSVLYEDLKRGVKEERELSIQSKDDITKVVTDEGQLILKSLKEVESVSVETVGKVIVIDQDK